MRNTMIFAVVAVLLGTAALLYDRITPKSLTPLQPAPSSSAAMVADFDFTTLQGQKIALSDLRGRVVIVNFWATWCPPCITEFPMLIDLTEKYPDRVLLLALSSDKDPTKVTDFITALEKRIGHKLNNTRVMIGIDTDRRITRDLFQVSTYPESTIVAPDGTNARHVIGIHDWDTPDVQKLIAELAARTDGKN